jgi:hypothetical protein
MPRFQIFEELPSARRELCVETSPNDANGHHAGRETRRARAKPAETLRVESQTRPPGVRPPRGEAIMETTSTREKPLDERTIRALEAELAELAAHIDAATCRLLQLIYEFDRNYGWQGWKSCAQWLSWRRGFGLESARGKIRVAPRSRSFRRSCPPSRRARSATARFGR